MPRFAAFLSYSRKDTDAVAPFKDAIEAAGLQAWFDQSELSGGDAWEAAIRRGLTQSNAVVIFVSKHIPASYAENEISLARDMRKPIIPVALDDTINTDTPAIAALRQFHYIDARVRPAAEVAGELVTAINKKHSAPVVSTYNVKGGVGKTTLTLNLAMFFYKQRRKRVLLIDFDPQTNLSTALVLPRIEKRRGGLLRSARNVRIDVLPPLQQIGKSISGVLHDAPAIAAQPDADFELAKYIHTIEGSADGPTLDIVAGDPALHRLAIEASASNVRRARDGFSRFVGQCRSKYSLILIDMGPSINMLSLCALAASTHVLSPVTPSMFAMQGLNLLEDLAVSDEIGSAGREHLVVINDSNKAGGDIVRKQIGNSHFKGALLASELRFSEHFSLKPSITVNPTLNFLVAYGAWGGSLNPARQSLQNVALEVGQRIGLTL